MRNQHTLGVMVDGLPWLEETLRCLGNARVAVFGDLALDAYWILDPDHEETSLETGLPVHRVASHRYQLGGAANVAANVADLGVGALSAVGLVGDDPFGRELRAQLERRGIDIDGVLDGPDGWQTLVFAKPHIHDAEQSRFDFGSINHATPAATRQLAERVDQAARSADAVILNQQAPGSVSSPEMIEQLNRIIGAHPDTTFLVDSRDQPDRFRGAVVTINAHEAARWCDALGDGDPTSRAGDHAARIHALTHHPVFVSRGADGIVAADHNGVHEVAGIPVPEPTDPVGAGDTVTAALAAALGAGCEVPAAAKLANLAAAVTVAKLRVTGTATPDEIRALATTT